MTAWFVWYDVTKHKKKGREKEHDKKKREWLAWNRRRKGGRKLRGCVAAGWRLVQTSDLRLKQSECECMCGGFDVITRIRGWSTHSDTLWGRGKCLARRLAVTTSAQWAWQVLWCVGEVVWQVNERCEVRLEKKVAKIPAVDGRERLVQAVVQRQGAHFESPIQHEWEEKSCQIDSKVKRRVKTKVLQHQFNKFEEKKEN